MFLSFLKMCSGKLGLLAVFFSSPFLFPSHGTLLLLLLNEAEELRLIVKDGAFKVVNLGMEKIKII